ncbi:MULTISPECIES: winged helix-turn-helix domain-containing protein [unclassified Bradyrhizobium]|uniref:winged helix-turn-helix domain-containing protein n=1 Tax=unclassified Bradyrhizobium TaxID=2631580 RepID=UPI001FFB7855|nr:MULTISPECIES: winged helix-turn-helix domain-containing protein [unclassified Bradyrhizobium]MCK1294519.1 winged helix-turn-helix transcriptional regulator [Bradyrhizobium sp. 30]MCK1305336.1 winged helix-turn-helix transcriptional regulator [Bradyrhizobium sp. 45]MCK1318372.1 winged helix-turn-helix transcriptional regulator [Bradyrhizobium sp. 23]MCK1508023.1 winged helix-turn-helix transcriptional regulator [Bradyrhizobium sp. 18]
MATSIRLAQDLAKALGIPAPTVLHILGGLRSAGLIVSYGRGPSATAMSKADASALLVGLASGAAASHVGPLTKKLLAMPLRHTLRPTVKGFGKLVNSRHRFYNFTETHRFSQGLGLLLDAQYDEPEVDDDGYRVDTTPFDWLSQLTVTVGTDARRSGGFAVIKSWSSSGAIANVYGTWAAVEPESPGEIDPAKLFEPKIGALVAMHMGGSALRTAIESLAEPVKSARTRPKRIAGVNRRAG